MRTNIITLFRNNANLLSGFFEGLNRFYHPPLVMIDQGSEDETLGYLGYYARPDDTVVSLGQNMPISVARNIGVRHAAADVHIFLDSDILLSTSVMPLADSFVTYPGAGVVLGTSVAQHNGEMNNGLCFAALRSETYDKIGGFYEGYTLFCDDTEYFESVNRLGLRVVHCPKCVGVHIGGATITHGSESHRREECLEKDTALLYERRATLGLTVQGVNSRMPEVGAR